MDGPMCSSPDCHADVNRDRRRLGPALAAAGLPFGANPHQRAVVARINAR